MYSYDIYGWYTGEAGSGRVTEIEPANKSTSSEAGSLRANWSGYEWVDVPYAHDDYTETVALFALKEAKRSELRDAYTQTTTQPIEHNSITWAAEKEDQDLLVRVLSVGAVPEGMYWRDINGVANPMSYADLQSLAEAILTRALMADMNLVGKLSLVDAANSEAEINSITW